MSGSGAGGRGRVVVVGAGLAGLSATCHLLGRGYDVQLLERASVPGGRAAREVTDGFVFDTGPTVLTMPDLVAATFQAAGRPMADYLRLRPLDPTYRACFADGTTIRVRRDPEAMKEEIRTTCGSRDAAAFPAFCDWLRRLYELEMPAFIDRNFDRPWDLAWPPSPALRLLRLGAFGKLHRIVEQYFSDERLHRLFSFQAMYAGLAPHDALAVYGVITYMDTVRGVYTAEGGMAALPEALAAAAVDAGAETRFDTSVARVLVSGDGTVGGVALEDGETVTADAVVLTADLPVAWRELLPRHAAPRRRRKPVYSPSAVVWHVGTRGAPPGDSEHHNIHFGASWRPAFDALLREGRRMPDPSVLVTVPTHTEPRFAPPDCSTLYVLEPVPNLDGRVDWDEEREPARERLRELVAGWGYPLEDVVTERFVDPTDWRTRGMAAGTPFALAHTFRQSGPFRPSNVDRRLSGLVFAGSGTVPGVGVPMVLLSGRLAAERVQQVRP